MRILALLAAPIALSAQQKTDLQQILERLERVEMENRNLANEVRALRAELSATRGAPPPAIAEPPLSIDAAAEPVVAPLEDRVAISERRIDELAQTKVDSSQKLGVTLNGMVLFNAFLNGRANGGAQYPVTANMADNLNVGGGTLAQSIIGLSFAGPRVAGGGQVSGSIQMDFAGGSGNSLNHLFRIRTATVQIDWKNQTVMVGQDKPLIAQRDPTSIAQVLVSPLTDAGNLWLWQPQVRVEQRFGFGETAGLRAQASVYQTAGVTYEGVNTPQRPGLEGRLEFWRKFGTNRRIEIAPGFHASQTHVAGGTAPSRLFAIDWLIQPLSKTTLTGTYFTGQNVAGLGGLRQGVTVFESAGVYRRIKSVDAEGGWAQIEYAFTPRLAMHVFGGQESNRPGDLLGGQITRNLAYAANAIYRLGPNVLLGFEASQVRTKFLRSASRLNNHYDVSLAYLF